MLAITAMQCHRSLRLRLELCQSLPERWTKFSPQRTSNIKHVTLRFRVFMSPDSLTTSSEVGSAHAAAGLCPWQHTLHTLASVQVVGATLRCRCNCQIPDLCQCKQSLQRWSTRYSTASLCALRIWVTMRSQCVEQTSVLFSDRRLREKVLLQSHSN